MKAAGKPTAGGRVVGATVRDAAIAVVVSTGLALAVNAVRSDGLPLVASKQFDILVPCPEPVGDPRELQAGDPLVRDPRSLVLDVRSHDEFGAWHLNAARNQPFDWLGPPVDAEVAAVAKQVAASGAQRVVVYGDGDDPDSGQEWAKLLSGARIKNVFFVQGGAPALNPALPRAGGLDGPAEPEAQAAPASSAPRPAATNAPGSETAEEVAP